MWSSYRSTGEKCYADALASGVDLQMMLKPRPQRGLPYVIGPLGGAFLKPRPLGVVDYSVQNRLDNI